MNLQHGTVLDYGVIAFYFVAILAFGSFFGRYTKSTKDFFFSGQRFSWWLISLSCVSMVVGSYSFVKYSAVGFSYGLSSSQTYLNDIFLAPLFMLGWLPIIYFSRVTSIPEYFERRFNRPTRIMAVIFIMIYMVGSIGINLFTMGIALHPIIPNFSVFQWAVIIAAITGVYCAFGGQTAVIMTDVVQSVMLLAAGFILLILGMMYLGDHTPPDVSSWTAFWTGLPTSYKMPFSGLVKPDEFPMAGIFWQDLFGSSMLFYFANQGLIMRFLATKSVAEGRRSIIFTIIVLMPMAAISVSGAGWVGKGLETFGLLPSGSNPKEIFIYVTEMVTVPGVFGFILAALVAALMSTIDALINAVAAIGINDVYRPFLVKGRTDKHYLRVAQWFSLGATFLGLIMVPVYMQFKSIYEAHAAFTAAISPPIICCVILGILWKRFSGWAAFLTLLLGGGVTILSLIWPQMIEPLAATHGMDPGAGINYLRALFLLICSGIIAVAASYYFTPRPVKELDGLWIGSMAAAKRMFKGREPNDAETGERIRLELVPIDERREDATGAELTPLAEISPADADRLKAKEGDLIYLADRRWWLGGLRSLHATLTIGGEAGKVLVSKDFIESGRIRPGEQVVVEKIL
jgi:SSS family solute:Na+ symporter